MARFELTDHAIAQWLARGEERFARDDQHRKLRLRAHDRRQDASWQLQVYQQGRSLTRTLGRWRELPAAVLLPQLQNQLVATALGRVEPLLRCTVVNDILNWYEREALSAYAERSPYRVNMTSAIKCHLRPLMGHMAVLMINQQSLFEQVLRPLISRYQATTVQALFKKIKTIFAAASRAGLLAYDPLATLRWQHFPEGIAPTPVALKSLSSLPALLAQLPKQRAAAATLCALLVMYGGRLTSVSQSRWADFDFHAMTWTIPAPTSGKPSTVPQTVPLTDYAVRWLMAYRQDQQRRGKYGLWLFPGHCNKPISAATANQYLHECAPTRSPLSASQLRRLVNSWWAELGIEPYVRQWLMNQRIRNRSVFCDDPWQVQYQALTQWHAQLDTMQLQPRWRDFAGDPAAVNRQPVQEV